DLVRFVKHEARLIDEKRFDEWYELFTDDAYYWVPAAPGQTDPLLHNSLAYEDKLLLRLRIERMKSPLAYSQRPASRCLHVLQEPDIEKADHAVTTVIHNAGVIRPALLPDLKLPDFNALVNVHLAAAIVLVQAALPTMKNAGYGRVVLVSSRAVLGLPTRTSYSATKAGMLGMARTWALELAPHGVTVNVVAPGPIQTANFHSIVPEGSPQVERVIDTI